MPSRSTPASAIGPPQRNIGRFLFLHPAAHDLYADWDHQIRGCVARLRALAAAPAAQGIPPGAQPK